MALAAVTLAGWLLLLLLLLLLLPLRVWDEPERTDTKEDEFDEGNE